MANGTGLSAGKSATQGVIIVPHPANKKIYYIFTAADRTSESRMVGFYYSVVNMELSNGLGAIEEKNIQLIKDNISEAVTATVDCTGEGMWVITHSEIGNIFYAFHVTANGVEKTPVMREFPGTKVPYFQPFVKISPNARQIALTTNFDKENNVPGPEALTLYDFDNITGIVSNKRTLINGNRDGCYGISFSPDNTKLYVGQWDADLDSYRDSAIAQFDVALAKETAIKSSKVNLPRKIAAAAMQLAYDGKIYISLGNYLSSIEQPNIAGQACGYRDKAVDLQGKYTNIGISNFPDNYFQQGRRFLQCAPPIQKIAPDKNNCLFCTTVIV